MTEFATFGEMLKHHRVKAGLTQRDVAATAGVSKTTVSNIENDKVQSDHGLPPRPTLETIDAICAAVHADPATARLLVYPPDERGGTSVIVASGENARLPDTSAGVNLPQTITDLRNQARAYTEVAERLTRTADELEEFCP